MGFTITDSDGNITREIWSCTECVWLSTKRHCQSTEDGPACVLCRAPCEKIDTQTETTGMPAYEYQELLTYLEDEVSGVGAGTVSSIQEHFEDGDAFLTAANNAYDNRAYEELSCVDGVGESTAEAIALGIADRKGWEDGLAESKFALS